MNTPPPFNWKPETPNEGYQRHYAEAKAMVLAWTPTVDSSKSRRWVEDQFRSWWRKTHGQKFQSSDVGYLHKLEAFIRHELTDYDAFGESVQAAHRVAGQQAMADFGQERVNPVIREAYPFVVVTSVALKRRRDW